MSEERATYHIQPESDDQDQQKAQPVSLTLTNEQVREVIQYAAQTSPELIVVEALALLARHPDGTFIADLGENTAQIIVKALIDRYPNLSKLTKTSS